MGAGGFALRRARARTGHPDPEPPWKKSARRWRVISLLLLFWNLFYIGNLPIGPVACLFAAMCFWMFDWIAKHPSNALRRPLMPHGMAIAVASSLALYALTCFGYIAVGLVRAVA